MRILFSHDERRALHLTHVPRPTRSPAYLAERERVWQGRVTAARLQGDHLWNGELSTIEHLLQWDETPILLAMSSCEGKDVVFRMHTGLAVLAQTYGTAPLPQSVTVDCMPVTSDGQWIFGVRGAGTHVQAGQGGLIGGTLNKLVASRPPVEERSIKEQE